jgi:hypothetical protein
MGHAAFGTEVFDAYSSADAADHREPPVRGAWPRLRCATNYELPVVDCAPKDFPSPEAW